MMDEEIRQALTEVREMKQMCGNINMKLTNIVTQRGQDWKKKLEAEYQRGLDDAWNVARKIAVETDDGGVSISALYEMFGTESMCMIMKNNTVYDAADKLKSYEEKQKADDEIKVGDVLEHTVSGYTSKAIFLEKIKDDDEDWYTCLFWTGTGCGLAILSYPKSQFKRTGRHFDIASTLKEMQS